jgi:soluble lytic murein transglycosylase
VVTLPPKEVDHVRLVSEIIEQDIPAHPEKLSLAALIVSESKRAEIDPLFVTAVVRTESHFRNKAVSRRGAKGLMQLMPATGRYISKLSRIELKNSDALSNPETNIRLGVWYLKHLHERFQGDRNHALVAYNWGPTNLRRAMANGSQLPQESVQYVHRVISHYTASTEKRRQYALTSQAGTSLG